MYSNTESHYSVIESKNHKGLLGKVSDAVRYLWTYWQSSDGSSNVNAMHHTSHLCNWFPIDCAACKWNTCTFAGLQAFVLDLQHHRMGLLWIERSFKEHPGAVTLSIYCMIISECVCVCESVLAVCAVSVVFEQRIHAAKIRGHPWHLTPINQTSAEFYSLSVSPFLFLPPSLSLPLTGSLHVVKFISPGDGWERNKRDEVGRKEKNRQWPWLGRWVNDQTSWQLCVSVCVCVCVCVFMPNVCVCVSVR